MRGVPVTGEVSGLKYQRTGLAAALMGDTVYGPLQYNGTMDSIFFETYFETRLLPTLPQNTVIVMDNASFHRKKSNKTLEEKNKEC
jgi:transposase